MLANAPRDPNRQKCDLQLAKHENFDQSSLNHFFSPFALPGKYLICPCGPGALRRPFINAAILSIEVKDTIAISRPMQSWGEPAAKSW